MVTTSGDVEGNGDGDGQSRASSGIAPGRPCESSRSADPSAGCGTTLTATARLLGSSGSSSGGAVSQCRARGRRLIGVRLRLRSPIGVLEDVVGHELDDEVVVVEVGRVDQRKRRLHRDGVMDVHGPHERTQPLYDP